MPQEKETKVSVTIGNLLGPFQCPPHEVQITTPAGAMINVDTAARSHDALHHLAASFTPSSPRCETDAERVERRLRELQGMVDTHRAERDDARRRADEARRRAGEASAELSRAREELFMQECKYEAQLVVRTEKADGLAPGTLEIVIREPSGKPAPADRKPGK